MINLVNNQYMTDAQRKESIFRGLHSQPFTNLFTFPVTSEAVKRPQWADKVDVDKDFWLTEIQGNFDEAQDETGTPFELSIYSVLNQGSVYKYLQTLNLPSGFIAQEARAVTNAFARQLYDDRQIEWCPYLIRSGDRVQARVQNVDAKTQPFDIHLALKGYYTYDNGYLSPNTTRGINESLAAPIRYENWTEIITHVQGSKVYSFNNDRTARMILGFQITDNLAADQNAADATISILDTFRNIKWSNVPIPIDFLAPRIGNTQKGVRDTNIYYLPVEYLWQPFSNLQCTIVNDMNGETNWKLTMLTRTV